VLLKSTSLETLDITTRGYVLDPVIPEQGLVMLFAPRGIGKTLLAMSIANVVAYGGALFTGKNGPLWFAPMQKRVLYVDGEMPLHTMKTRQKAIKAGLSLSASLDDKLSYVNPELQPDFLMPKLATKAGQEQVGSVLDDFDFIILDNLATLCGNGRENDVDGWLPVQEWLLQLRRLGKSVLVVHHAGKGGDQRGTSAREDVLDTVIKLRRPDDYMPDDGARFIVELTKARGLYGQEANPFEATLMQDSDTLLWTIKDIGNQEIDDVRALLDERKSIRQIAKELELSKSKVGRLVNIIRNSQ
jgi:putative DNA primase/helicase